MAEPIRSQHIHYQVVLSTGERVNNPCLMHFIWDTCWGYFRPQENAKSSKQTLEIVKRNHQWKNPTIIYLRNDRNIKKLQRNTKIELTFVEINTHILTSAQKCIHKPFKYLNMFTRIHNFKRIKSLLVHSVK